MISLRRHSWWLLPEVVAVAVLALGLAAFRSNGLHRQLDPLVQARLEQLSPAELELYDMHGHVASHDAKVICAVEAFGTEPANAQRVEDVRLVYAHYLCALVQPKTPWDYASRSAGPVVISLTDITSVQIAQSGPGYPGRVEAMIPDDLEPQAFAGFRDSGRSTALLARYNDEVS